MEVYRALYICSYPIFLERQYRTAFWGKLKKMEPLPGAGTCALFIHLILGPGVDSSSQLFRVESSQASPAIQKNWAKQHVWPVLRHVLADQKVIWTAPLRAREHAAWIAPVAGATAALTVIDRSASRKLSPDRGLRISSHISNLGHFANYGMAGMYVAGKLSGDERMSETGLRALEAALYAPWIVDATKAATNRRRPNREGNGHFWNGGDSFPSGHAARSWALATVVAHQYSDNRFIKFGAYTGAVLISISRVTGRNHYPSDVLIGSTLGYLVGRYVISHHTRTP